jgi:hypothetical protein
MTGHPRRLTQAFPVCFRLYNIQRFFWNSRKIISDNFEVAEVAIVEGEPDIFLKDAIEQTHLITDHSNKKYF